MKKQGVIAFKYFFLGVFNVVALKKKKKNTYDGILSKNKKKEKIKTNNNRTCYGLVS